MSGRLAGRRAVVFGAGRGIGQAIARGLAREDARVVCASRSLEHSERTAASIRDAGGDATAFRVDISQRPSAEEAFGRGHDWLGGVDIFVQAAGVAGTTAFLDITEEEWRWVLGTNLDGTFYSCQAAARRMVQDQTRGAIVIVTSQLSQVAIPNKAHYVASKGGLSLLTKAMALELAPHGIRVNAVAPGITRTDMAMSRLNHDAEALAWSEARIPMGRLAEADEMAGAAIFLASDEASYVTGTTVVVDGGYLTV